MFNKIKVCKVIMLKYRYFLTIYLTIINFIIVFNNIPIFTLPNGKIPTHNWYILYFNSIYKHAYHPL